MISLGDDSDGGMLRVDYSGLLKQRETFTRRDGCLCDRPGSGREGDEEGSVDCDDGSSESPTPSRRRLELWSTPED